MSAKMPEPILVTGGPGFLGSHLIDELKRRGYENIRSVGRKGGDLNHPEVARRHMRGIATVFHLAAKVGGIGANAADPYYFWRENLLPGVNIIEEAVESTSIRVVVMVSSVCVYPYSPPTIPFQEGDIWEGYPETTNAPYGVAKRCLHTGLQAAAAVGLFRAITAIPTNLYGPRESFHLENSHVIPGMIRKFIEARELDKARVELWGTGKPSRDFLYVSDAARALAGCGEALADHERMIVPALNFGSGKEVTIQTLAEIISGLVGFEGEIIWDRTKPDGQPRRCIDSVLAEAELGWGPEISLENGLRRTLAWYTEHRGTSAARE